jgi:hypothetical protein
MNVRRMVSGLTAGVISLLLVACVSDQPLSPSPSPQQLAAFSVAAQGGGKPPATPGPNENACWGQASAVFAQMGEMGEHASSFDTPRLGLRNLARDLYARGIIPDDTMQALGAFVATELKLSIDACGTDFPEE